MLVVQAEFPIARLLRVRLPPGGVFSGRTAAWLYGINVPPCSPIEVTLPRLGHTSRLAGVSLRRSDLHPGDVDTINGLPTTSIVRTLADLARRLPEVEAVAILDVAFHARLVPIEQLTLWARNNHHYWGVARLLNVIDLADGAAESPMETRLRLLLISGGLPRPRLQVSLYDQSGMFVARPDLYYPDARLAIEYDGAIHRHTFAAENRRQNRLLEAGYRLLRFTAADVLQSPAGVVSQVRRLLDRFAELPAPRLR
jgi:very-short-patch-repair endonuclease